MSRRKPAAKAFHLCCVYGVTPAAAPLDPGAIDVREGPLRSIRADSIAGLVGHETSPPFDAADAGRLKGYLQTHQRVLEAVIHQNVTVLPLPFATIFSGDSPEAAEAAVGAWLSGEKERFAAKLAEVADCAEYLVRLNWRRRRFTHWLSGEDEAPAPAAARPAAGAHQSLVLLQRQMQRTLALLLEQEYRQCFEEIFATLARHSRQVHIDAPTPGGPKGWDQLLQFSCLLPRDKADAAERDVAAVADRCDLNCSFSGPWPPYNFG